MTKTEAKELTAETREKIRIRIRMIKAENSWTVKDLADVTGDTNVTMKSKLGGNKKYQFTINDIILISMKSGRSLDYICGRSDS